MSVNIEKNTAIAAAFDAWIRQARCHGWVERQTGYSRSQLYEWQRGRYPIPVYALADVYRAIPDPAALERVLGLSALGLRLSRVEVAPAVDDVWSAVAHVTEDTGIVAGEARRALADRQIDATEAPRVVGAIEESIRALEELRATVLLASRRPCIRVEGRQAPAGVRASS